MMVELKYKLGELKSDVKQLNKKIVVNTLPKGAPGSTVALRQRFSPTYQQHLGRELFLLTEFLPLVFISNLCKSNVVYFS